MLNLKRFPYYSIDQFLAAKKRRRDSWRLAGFLALQVAFAIGFPAVHWFLHHDFHRATKVSDGPFIVPGFSSGARRFILAPDQYGKDVTRAGTLDAWRSSLLEATKLWERALGHPIRPATLVTNGDCSADTAAIACADRINWTINIIGRGSEYDRTSVMMHEIAHLLGVPHIEGDPLMESSYQQKVDEPTPAAIALAKLRR
jgi:hypothetical protein